MSELVAPENGRYELDIGRSLVPRALRIASGLEEFYDSNIGSRIISIPKGSPDAQIHEDLLEKRMPVFSALSRGDSLYLLVPEGSRALRKALPLIGRDIVSYAEIFSELGMTLGKLEEAVGVPEASQDRSVLDSFAITLDQQESSGGRILLVPPYRLNPVKNHRHELNAVYEELTGSRYFSDEIVRYLLGKLTDGWQAELIRQFGEGSHG